LSYSKVIPITTSTDKPSRANNNTPKTKQLSYESYNYGHFDHPFNRPLPGSLSQVGPVAPLPTIQTLKLRINAIPDEHEYPSLLSQYDLIPSLDTSFGDKPKATLLSVCRWSSP
jgi:hypothetical protein